MASYEFLAGSYDAFTADVGYPRWADYIEGHFARLQKPVHTVLDLCCGTGSLTYELSRRGYELTGVDLSADMLSLAEEKCRDLPVRPRFFCQPMENLRLPFEVDACVCCLDSVNYVLKPQKLQRAFQRVFDCLAPGGLFLFDADTPEKLESMDGQVFLDETEDGDIILLHDIYPASVDTALQVVDALMARGFHFVTVEELFAIRGEKPENGKVYRHLPPSLG